MGPKVCDCRCPNEKYRDSRSFRLTFVTDAVNLSGRYLRFGCCVPTLDSRPLQPDRSYQKALLSNDNFAFQVSLRHSWRGRANDVVVFGERAITSPALSHPDNRRPHYARFFLPSLVEVREALVTGVSFSTRGNEIVAARRPTTAEFQSHLLRECGKERVSL